MINLFTYNVIHKFEPFSLSHFTAIGVVLLFMVGVLFILKEINVKKHQNENRYFAYTLAGALILLELSNTIWHIVVGHFSITDSLPLHLCGLAVFTCSIMLITGNYFLFEFNYFVGIGGALQAIITPDVSRDFPHFEFIQLFSTHALIILSVLYMIFILKYIPTWKSAVKTFLLTNIYLVLIYIFNCFTGSNYMYISRVPEFPTVIDLLVEIFGQHPYYIIGLECMGVFVFAILLFPLYVRKVYKRLGIGTCTNLR